MDYKRGIKDRPDSIRTKSALCEVACEQNSCGLKISVASRIANICVRRIWNKQLLLYLLFYKLETVGHINRAYNKEKLKLGIIICT